GVGGGIERGRKERAGGVDTWRRALERPRPTVRPEGVPSPIVPRTELARAMLRAGRPAEAGEQLRIALAESPDPEASWLLSRVDLQRKDWPATRADRERRGAFRPNRPLHPRPAPTAARP